MKRTTIMVLLLATLMASIWMVLGSAQGEELKNEGAGLYTDPSVANQISTFTINPRMISCGVGTFTGAGFGAFEMIMFSTNKHAYRVNPPTNSINANGEMRSITRVAGVVVEDVIHPFLAFAQDNQPSRPQPNATDRFEVHFVTPFWNPLNPLCTKSDRVPGWCRFGGDVVLGDVSVAPFK